MRMNSAIPLSGNQLNYLQTIADGQALGQRTLDNRQVNDTRNFMRENGGAVLAGDQNALAQYAQFDVQGAQGVQANMLGQQAMRQDMQVQRQTQARLSRQEQRQIEAHAASLTAAEAAAQRAEIESDLGVLMTGQTPEQWDALARQTGNPEFVGQFANREAVIAPFIGLAEVLDRQAQLQPEAPAVPASVQALQFRAEQAGLQAGSPEYKQFMASGGVPTQNTTLTTTPEGGVSFSQGTGAQPSGNGKSLTVDEAKNTGFLIRARDAEAVLSQFASEGTSARGRILNNVPFGVGNYAQSEEYQLFDQAKRDFVNAILRRESGAVISPEEFDNADKQYFPQPGNGEAVMAQKARNRANAIRGLEVGSGDGVNRVNEPTSTDVMDFSNMSLSELSSQDIGTMTLDQINAWNKRMDEVGG